MFEYLKKITRKQIVVGFLGLIGLIILLAGLNGGLIIVQSNEALDLDVVYKRTGTSDTEQKEETIGASGWKLKYLNSGKYRVSVYDDHRESIYQPSIGPFSITTVTVSLKEQKESTNLGYQNSDCAYENRKTNSVIYYFCDKSVENLGYFTSTSDGNTFSDKTYKSVAKPYGNGLLSLSSSDTSWYIDYWTISNNTPVKKEVTSIDLNYTSTLPQNTIITDSTNTDNPRFIYFNTKTGDVSVYKNVSDVSPLKIKLAKQVTLESPYVIRLSLVGNRLFVYNTIDAEEAIGYGDEKPVKPKGKEQKVLEYNVDTAALTKNFLIDENIYVNHASTDKSGDTALSAVSTSGEEFIYIYTADGKVKDKSIVRSVNDMCWGEHGLYYIGSEDNSNINLYSQEDKSSSVTYRNTTDNIAGLMCVNNEVYFYSVSQINPDSDYRWFRLENRDYSSDKYRVESVFPIIDDLTSGIDYSYAFKDRLVIYLKDNGSCNVSNDAKLRVKKLLDDLGIDTSKYRLDILRNCGY